MNEEQVTKSKISTKLVIVFLICLLALGGVLAFLFKYYELFSQVSNNVNKNPMQQQAVNTVKLTENYREKSQAVISDYLSQSSGLLTEGKLSQATESTRDQLLAMKVSAEDKARHLGMVLLLEEIDRLAKSNEVDKVNFKLKELKELSEKSN